jgi:hypothetical protein
MVQNSRSKKKVKVEFRHEAEQKLMLPFDVS